MKVTVAVEYANSIGVSKEQVKSRSTKTRWGRLKKEISPNTRWSKPGIQPCRIGVQNTYLYEVLDSIRYGIHITVDGFLRRAAGLWVHLNLMGVWPYQLLKLKTVYA